MNKERFICYIAKSDSIEIVLPDFDMVLGDVILTFIKEENDELIYSKMVYLFELCSIEGSFYGQSGLVKNAIIKKYPEFAI